MILNLMFLAVGLGLIIKGGDWFVSASVRIAEMLRMPRVVIGSTLVSLTTTSPELVVSVMSGVRGESGLAVGNAVGSCICNIGLIVGFMAAVKNVEVHPKLLRLPLIAMLAVGLLVLGFTQDLLVTRTQGLILILVGGAYFVFDFLHHHRHAGPVEVVEADLIKEEKIGGHPWLATGWGTTCQFAAGAVLVIAGSKLLVDSAVALATAFGIPSIIIGLTVVAVGTSLPELITAWTSARQNVSDLAIGNVLGANVANMTLIVGTASSIHEVTMSRLTQIFNFPAMVILMALLVFMILSEKRITRREGSILLGFYGLYIVTLVTLTLLGKT